MGLPLLRRDGGLKIFCECRRVAAEGALTRLTSAYHSAQRGCAMNTPRICSVGECCKPAKARGRCNTHYNHGRKNGELTRLRAPRGEGRRFIANAMMTETRECIIWPFGKDKDGYGVTSENGVWRYAHSIVCERAHGARQPGREVCHSCGFRACINKSHLRWGTVQDNADDRAIHERNMTGEKNVNCKLTKAQVLEIRSMYPANRLVVIAEKYGVSTHTVHCITSRKTWAWL